MPGATIVTCEHGGNGVPDRYRTLFSSAGTALDSHQAYDIGALDVARTLAHLLGTDPLYATVTRLLVDLNRSASNRKVFSKFTRGLKAVEKAALIRAFHEPHRNRVQERIASLVDREKRVLHLSVHSFTPSLNGVARTADLGLLYDPSRGSERAFAAAFISALAPIRPGWKLRRNYPYRGSSDGLTTYLRTVFADSKYLGIELEINQRLLPSRMECTRVADPIATALKGLDRWSNTSVGNPPR